MLMLICMVCGGTGLTLLLYSLCTDYCCWGRGGGRGSDEKEKRMIFRIIAGKVFECCVCVFVFAWNIWK